MAPAPSRPAKEPFDFNKFSASWTVPDSYSDEEPDPETVPLPLPGHRKPLGVRGFGPLFPSQAERYSAQNGKFVTGKLVVSSAASQNGRVNSVHSATSANLVKAYVPPKIDLTQGWPRPPPRVSGPPKEVLPSSSPNEVLPSSSAAKKPNAEVPSSNFVSKDGKCGTIIDSARQTPVRQLTPPKRTWTWTKDPQLQFLQAQEIVEWQKHMNIARKDSFSRHELVTMDWVQFQQQYVKVSSAFLKSMEPEVEETKGYQDRGAVSADDDLYNDLYNDPSEPDSDMERFGQVRLIDFE